MKENNTALALAGITFLVALAGCIIGLLSLSKADSAQLEIDILHEEIDLLHDEIELLRAGAAPEHIEALHEKRELLHEKLEGLAASHGHSHD